MKAKKICGDLLMILGMGGLVYAAIIFINPPGESRNTIALAIFGILGVLFFFSGITLILSTKHKS
jgi:hypothetical protein